VLAGALVIILAQLSAPQGFVAVPDPELGNAAWYLISQPQMPFVDPAGHICWQGYIGLEYPGQPGQVLSNVSCETAAGLAWIEANPQWSAWLAENDPNPIPAP
jgi:hypothetical protein